MGIFLPKDLQNFFGVGVVLGKQNRLAQRFPVVDPQALGHQNVQDQTDGILVKNHFVQLSRANAVRPVAVLVQKRLLVGGLFLWGQVVVGDAFLQKFQFRLCHPVVHQIAVLHGLGQVIAIRRDPVFQLKDLIRILVDLILRRGGQAH